MVGEMKVMVTSFKMTSAHTVVFSAPDPTTRPRSTHASAGDSWTLTGKSGSVSCWGHYFFLLAPDVYKVLFVSSKSLFPQSCGSSVIKSHGLQSQIPWGCSVPLPDPLDGKSVVGSRTFLTVQEFLWYNCSAVCVSSAQRLYSVANGNLLQDGLCHTLHDPGLLQPEPLSLWQATADQCLHKRHPKAGLSQSLWGLWVLVRTRFCLSPLSISAGLGFDSKCDYALLHLVWGVLFCPLMCGILLLVGHDRQVKVESSDKTWSPGEGNGKPLQYSCPENPMNSMKRQKDRTRKDELPKLVGAQYATGREWRNNSR